MSDDWFRNTDWNEAISRRFDEKLKRARRKEQYLRIQACTLAPTHPVIALELLDRYFKLPDNFDHAQGFVDRATALRALGRIEEAVASYEAALEREVAFPNLKTEAYLELPYVIATESLRARYDQALAILDEHKDRLTFPVEHFLWHALHALILADSGARAAAVPHAHQALALASVDHCGLRYHPAVGLVRSKYEELVAKVAALRPA
jgi:tetratricopeptide (TPR) repeat protein